MMTVVQAADRGAYEEVFVAHYRQLLRVAYALRGDLAAAEDDVADAFARAWGPWERGQVRDVAAYLTRTVINRSHSAHRRQRVETRHRRQGSDAYLATAVEDRELLRPALLSLPHGQRVAVVLRYVNDLSEQMTADVMGVSVGTVKSQVARALASLRIALDHEETDR